MLEKSTKLQHRMTYLSLSLSLMIAREIRSEKNASLACVLQADCKVHTQKSGCRKVNILLDLCNYYVMHMDRGEHSLFPPALGNDDAYPRRVDPANNSDASQCPPG